jgi:dTDP-4-amino-4,6-dideoxygalactose transaminase
VTTAVPFGDMKARVASLRVEIDAAVARVLESGWFILGPEGEAFERELAAALGAADAVGVANGTDAIELALHDLGVGPGDEVVTSPLTAAFTALAIARTGARPVFADLDPLREIADAHGIMLVEDACQAVGARYKGRTVGSITGLGALSFYPTKNLGAFGDGGAILVNDPARAARLRRQRNGGQSDRYRHEVLGVNSRLDEMQAALLRIGLAHLPEWTARRRQIAALYLRELAGAGVGLPQEQPYAEAVYHLFVIRHPRRDALMAALKERGIGTLIHYPIPLHLQPAFPESGRPGDFPEAERAAGEILSLPIYPEMTDAQVRTVAAAVRESVSSLG